MKSEKYSIIALACAAVTLALNTGAYFFLPDTIVTQISFSGGRHSSTLLYLIMSAVLIALSAAMTVYGNNKSKWLAVTAILTAMNLLLLIINL